MSKREKHTVNGKFYGAYYTLDSGRELYLAHRRRDQYLRQENAWCLDVQTLDRCQRRGIKVVGVIARDGATKLIWLTLLDDFFNHPSSFKHFAGSLQRGLPMACFRIDPMKDPKVIEKSLKIR